MSASLTEQKETTMSIFTFRVEDMRAEKDALDLCTAEYLAARALGKVEMTGPQKVNALFHTARTRAFNMARADLSEASVKYLDALVKAVDRVEVPDEALAPTTAIDRTEGDDHASTIGYMVSLSEAGKANMVPDDLRDACKVSLGAWQETRPTRGARNADSPDAGKGEAFPGPILLTRDGETLAEEGHRSAKGGPNVQSIGVAALRQWRVDHGHEGRNKEVKAPTEWTKARRVAFDAIQSGDASAEWVDAEGRVYRVERV